MTKSMLSVILLITIVVYNDCFVTTLSTNIKINEVKHKDYAEAQAFTYTLDKEYPIDKHLFGSISGIDVDQDNNIVIFHRGDHEWTQSGTFDSKNQYIANRNEPISQETVITIDPKEKKITRAWGRDTFFIPHGLSLDIDKKNVWLTDCALHQVFKFPIEGPNSESEKPLITLGIAFEPGNDDSHFCKPTSVADTGEFVFVADGYCNSRVIMFSDSGRYLSQFGQSRSVFPPSSRQPTFMIPHKIVYAKEAEMLCVADRENGRIQCFYFKPKRGDENAVQIQEGGVLMNGAISTAFVIADPDFNGRLFSLDYSPYMGGILVAVSGESMYDESIRPVGFVYNVTTGKLISQFKPPSGKSFGMSHDLAIVNGNAESIYVVDVKPVNLWKFSRRAYLDQYLYPSAVGNESSLTTAARLHAVPGDKRSYFFYIFYPILFLLFILIIYGLSKKSRRISYGIPSNSFSSLYGESYTPSISFLRGTRFRTKANPKAFLSTLFSRRAFYGLVDRSSRQQDEFSRVPLEESENSDEDKSDSDVEEFNINQATTSIKIDV